MPIGRMWCGWLGSALAGVVASRVVAFSAPMDPSATPAAVREILRRRCFECHGANGSAEKGIFVLDHDQLSAQGMVRPRDRKSPLLQAIENGSMPLGADPLPASEVARVRAWIDSGAPSWSAPVASSGDAAGKWLSDEALWKIVEVDLLGAEETERPHWRYISLAVPANAGASSGELEGFRHGVSRLLNSLSWKPAVARPQPVDSAGLVLRIDLREYGWDAGTWQELVAHYPYGLESPVVQRAERLAGAELPCLRADWLAAVGSVPPLYHRLLELPATVPELEERLGVDASTGKQGVRAGFARSGVSRHNRVVERYPTVSGAYWKSFDFASSSGDANVLEHPLAFRADGGEMIFSLPNGLQGYFIADARGRRLDRAPVEIVADRTDPGDPRVVNGRSCMRCHAAGMKPFRDDVRAMAELRPAGDPERSRLLELYPPQAELDRLLGRDTERFRRAAEQAGGRVSPDFRAEPIGVLAARFEGDVTVTGAAAEVGLEPATFRQRFAASPRLERLGIGRLLRGGTLPREAWEAAFVEARVELGAGEPAPAATGPRGGVLVLSADDWPTRGENAAQFARNLASYFTRGRAGRLLIYSTHPAFGADFRTALEQAGHRVEQTLEPARFTGYDAVFVGGDAEVDPEALGEYLRRGGKVYLAGGTGAITGESTFWNGMLARFGLRLGRATAVRREQLRQFEASPLFRGIGVLEGRGPTSIALLSGPSPTRVLAAEHGVNWLAECRLSEPVERER